MRTLVIGAGAVGGYFGALLTHAGRDVTFLVRQRRFEQLRRNGLHIFSPHGDFRITPKLVLAKELAAEPNSFDLILLSTKAYSLAAAMEDFAPAVGPKTAILPLLNGMAHMDDLIARFGEGAVLGGSTRVVADLDENGYVHSLEQLHDLNFGELDKQITPRIEAIDAVLSDAGFDARLQPDILATMWHKWVFLASLGAITCLMRGSIGDVAAAHGGTATAQAIITEANTIATAKGYPTPVATLEALTARLLKPGSVLTASMYRDMTKGSPVEADHILGDLLRRGREEQIAAPLLQAAYAQLSIYSASLAKL